MLLKKYRNAFYLNNEKWICGLFSILLLCNTMAIFRSETTIVNATGKQFLLIVRPLFVFIGVMFFLFYYVRHREELKFKWILLIPVVNFIVRFLDRYSSNIVGVLATWEIIGYILLQEKYKIRIYNIYRNFLIFQSFIGVVCYVLYLLDVHLYRVVPYYSSSYMSYLDFGWAYLLKGYLPWPRLCGLFDEPGHLGTVLALILCADNVNFHNRHNVLLIIAGFLTFSLAFWCILAIYIFLTSFKTWRRLLILSSLLIICISVPYNIHFENERLQSLIERVEIIDGKMRGDNRSNYYLDSVYQTVISSSDDVLFGRGGGFSTQSYFRGASSIKMYIVDYGILGTLILYFPLFLAAWKSTSNDMYILAYVICFFSSIYQRPGIHILPFYILLLGGIEYMKIKRI